MDRKSAALPPELLPLQPGLEILRLAALVAEQETRGADDRDAGLEDADAEALRLLDEVIERAPGNLAALVERARIAARRGDVERLERSRDAVARLTDGWDDRALEQFAILEEAIDAGDLDEAARRTAFVRNVLTAQPAFQESLAAVRTPAELIAEPFDRFLVLEPPRAEPAPADRTITFVAAPAATRASSLGASATRSTASPPGRARRRSSFSPVTYQRTTEPPACPTAMLRLRAEAASAVTGVPSPPRVCPAARRFPSGVPASSGLVRNQTLTRPVESPTTSELRESTGVQVVALQDTPHPGDDVPRCLAENMDDVRACAVDREEALKDPERRALTAQRAAASGALVVDPVPWFCREECPAIIGNTPAYHDDDHITATYAQTLAPLLEERLVAALGRGEDRT